MGLLSKIARQYDVAVVVTNQIYSAIDEDGKDDIKAVGGTILQYWSKVIIQLERGEETNQRIATLKRHRSIPEGKQAIFSITSRGIV
jgi:DNA repair protein RadB